MHNLSRVLPWRRNWWLLVIASVLTFFFAGHSSAETADARRDYVLGAGDVVRINVYQNQDLTLETRVSESGTISYPLLGTVQLGGLSIPEAEKVVANGLLKGNFLRQPQVSILLLQIRGSQVSVLGAVNRPGRFPLEVGSVRVSEMLAVAGGITTGGSDVVILNGVRNGKLIRQQINIATLFTDGSGADPLVQNGDTLYVDRMPVVYIYGEVQRPGVMRLERGMTVIQALAIGGGTTQRGTIKGLKVHRRTGAGSAVLELEPAMTEELKDGDVIYVRESLF
ncbi:polysaccharide export protein EpsE [Sphaerotilus microaerophilus]|uniref:Polysaccharide export protein n=1 Tax=Sphaerotilus microaerophilus TaxID=2914710 RepID=A0ABM7YKI4_9BURK|nr:polysaccharide export protein EpsE [Sphaerotilus sp. FB-5]BDI04929.1 polysaccharide export protein [Sphaerotilus sp. FB-5]